MLRLIIIIILVDIAFGDIYASVGHGQVKRFDNQGNLLQVMSSQNNTFTVGMAFDSENNLYVAKLDLGVVSKFDSNGIIQVEKYFECDILSNVEGIVAHPNGNFYVGQGLGTKRLLYFDKNGTRISSFAPAVDSSGGTSRIALSSDNCTLFYTSGSIQIKRFNVCTGMQMTDFANVPNTIPLALGLKVRPNGEVIVANLISVHRFNAAGQLLQSYTHSSCTVGKCIMYSIALDNDNSSFWVGDIQNGMIYHFDMLSGGILNSFNSTPNSVLGSIEIHDRSIEAIIKVTPLIQNITVGIQTTIYVTLENFQNNSASVLIEINGINGLNTFNVTTDLSGNAYFYYVGSNIGDDFIVAKYNGKISKPAIVNWKLGNVCQYNSQMCINSINYKTCRMNDKYETFWEESSCCNGYSCVQLENSTIVLCSSSNNYSPSLSLSHSLSISISATLYCVNGQMKCEGSNQYRSCNEHVWGPKQSCSSSLFCKQDVDTIYCVDGSAVSTPEICEELNMRCSGTAKYQTCQYRYGSFNWGPEQLCPSNTLCHQSDSVIYCY